LGFDPKWHPVLRLLQGRVEPGFFAVLSAPTIEQAQAIVDSSAQRQEVFDLEIVPIKQFPHFD
jgi:hypothetical protein